MDASIAIFASTSRAPQARGYNTAAENILKIFYHGTVDVLPPVLGSRHEKIQNSLSASQFARRPVLRSARSNRARAPHSSRAASFLGGCYPPPASPAKGVRLRCREAGLNCGRKSGAREAAVEPNSRRRRRQKIVQIWIATNNATRYEFVEDRISDPVTRRISVCPSSRDAATSRASSSPEPPRQPATTRPRIERARAFC
jgi:hypothetical protein